jgi:hypothetical protein
LFKKGETVRKVSEPDMVDALAELAMELVTANERNGLISWAAVITPSLPAS